MRYPQRMWTLKNLPLADAHGHRTTIDYNGRAAPFLDVICAWQSDNDFRTLFIDALVRAPYSAFRWETPGVTKSLAVRPFEFVLLDSPGLDRPTEPRAFAEHFPHATDGMTAFKNLGGDSVLISPVPAAPDDSYAHLASFLRHAPSEQQHALWRTVGAAMTERLSEKPVWLSTAGAGVAWLHVRLDDRPKYYGHAAYRKL